MNVNSSLDFLNMIKTSSTSPRTKAAQPAPAPKPTAEAKTVAAPKPVSAPFIPNSSKDMIAVIDLPYLVKDITSLILSAT